MTDEPPTTQAAPTPEPEPYEPLTPARIRNILEDDEPNAKGRARARTADDLIHRFHFATMTDTKELYVYRDGFYQPDGERIVAAEVKRLWVDQHTTGDVKEITDAHIKPLTYIEREEFNADISRTNILNGILNLDTGTLEPHDPNHRFTFQLPLVYDPEAKCPGFDKFILEVVADPKDVDTIYEAFAYCLHRRYPKAKILTLIGEGSNGKSQLLGVLKYFLGTKNVRALSLQQLEHDQYAKAQLFGLHANINPDIGNKKINTQGAIKQLTGGADEVDTNVKFRSHMKYMPFAKLIFGTNDLPQSDDTTHAWSRRWIFLRFPHLFEPGRVCPRCHTQHDVIPDISELLKLETSGILNKVIEAYRRLSAARWEFTMSDAVKRMEQDYHIISDPVAGFVKDMVIEDDTMSVEKTIVHDAYRKYVAELDEPALSGNVFSVRFKQHLPNVRDGKTGSKRRWVGIRLKTDAEQSALDFVDNPDGGLSPSTLKKMGELGGWSEVK